MCCNPNEFHLCVVDVGERRLDKVVKLLVALTQQRHRVASVVVADDAVLGHGVGARTKLDELGRAWFAILMN